MMEWFSSVIHSYASSSKLLYTAVLKQKELPFLAAVLMALPVSARRPAAQSQLELYLWIMFAGNEHYPY